MTVIQIITLVIAIYGAVLATYTAVRAYFRDQPALKVKMSHSYGVGSMAGHAWLTVTVVNVGHRPVTICNPGFMLPDRARLFSPEEEARLGLPGKLAEGGKLRPEDRLRGCEVGPDSARLEGSAPAPGVQRRDWPEFHRQGAASQR